MDLSIFDNISFQIEDPNSLAMHVLEFNKSSLLKYEDWPEIFKIKWNMPSMGKNITIYYPIDSYEEMNPISVSYNCGNSEYSPSNIIYMIFKHYSDPLSEEELKRIIETEAVDYLIINEAREALESNTSFSRSSVFQNNPFFGGFEYIGPKSLLLRFD